MTATSPPPVCGTCGQPYSELCGATFGENGMISCPNLKDDLLTAPTESAPPLYDAALGDPTRHEQWTESATTTADQQQNQSGKTEKGQRESSSAREATVPDEIAWVIVRNPSSLGLSYFTGFNGNWHTAWSRNHGDAQRFATRAEATRVLQDGIDHGGGAFRPDARVEEHMWVAAAPLGEPPSEPLDAKERDMLKRWAENVRDGKPGLGQSADAQRHASTILAYESALTELESSRSALVADHRALGDECAALVAHRDSLEDRVRALTEEVRRLRDDAARLDWLESHRKMADAWEITLLGWADNSVRETIDAALRAALTPSPEQAAP